MVCDDVKRIVYFYLDGQLGRNKQSDFDDHLKECSGCGDRVAIHRRLRRFIIKRVSKLPAPSSLQLRLRRQFESLRSDSSGLV